MSDSHATAITDYLILPHLRIQNANAISGPFTHGFPSITAFTGLMWALERKRREAEVKISFRQVGVIAHSVQELAAGDDYSPKVFHLTRHRVRTNGMPLPIQGEGRLHMEISLIFGVYLEADFISASEREALAKEILEIVHSMRVAGGTVLSDSLPGAPPAYKTVPYLVGKQAFEENWKQERNRFLPGFALIERAELIDQRLKELQQEQKEGEAEPTRLEAWLSLCAVNWCSGEEDAKGKAEWRHDREKGSGWIVPISVGYAAIGPLHEAGVVKEARDNKTRFQAVEALQSIGEWKFSPRIREVSELLWCVENDLETGFYRCRSLKEFSLKEPAGSFDDDVENLSG